jgi:N-acetyl-gamma-glutamyl-phosphate reductase
VYTIFIDGNQGTTGLRLVDRLAGREELTLLTLPEEERKDLSARVSMAKQADVTFLCLPDEASREMVNALEGSPGTIIDASTAHRIEPEFAYGFAELDDKFAKAIQKARRIAVPGCHASGAAALLYPLVKARILPSSAPVIITSITGYSGGGKAMIAQYEAPDRDPALYTPRPYAVGQSHKHLAEIKEICNLVRPPLFQPIVCDFYSGMLVGVPLEMEWLTAPGGAMARGGVDYLTNLYRNHYAGKKLISVLAPNPDPFLSPLTMAGMDGMQIFVTGNEERMIAYARFDNLGKGASGAAIQCMNLRLGLEETAGLVAGL